MPTRLEMLKRLLSDEWDPLGLSHCEGAECHYDPYASRVLKRLAEGADVDAIAKYLSSIVTTELSVAGNIACDHAIAAKAVEIFDRQDKRDAAEFMQE